MYRTADPILRDLKTVKANKALTPVYDPVVREYESECARLGFTTRRVPFHHESGAACFALITAPPGHPTGTSIESWTLFDADETRQLLDGVINGHGANYLGKLAAHGYRPDEPAAAADPQPIPQPAAQLIDDSGQFCFLF